MADFAWPDGLFLCPSCEEELPARSFYKRRFTHASGSRLCRTCNRAAMLARIAPRRALVDRIKLERGCEDERCAGHPPDPCVLDFDHRPGSEKLYDIAGIITRWSYDVWLERTMEEVAKCDVVCANCHQVRTNRDGRSTAADYDLRR